MKKILNPPSLGLIQKHNGEIEPRYIRVTVTHFLLLGSPIYFWLHLALESNIPEILCTSMMTGVLVRENDEFDP